MCNAYAERGIRLSGSQFDNLGLRILLSSKEMAKSIIFCNLGRANILNGDSLSAGVNSYYSLYHSCVSVISAVSKEIEVNQCIGEWEVREKLPRYYIPLTHSKTKKLIQQSDAEL